MALLSFGTFHSHDAMARIVEGGEYLFVNGAWELQPEKQQFKKVNEGTAQPSKTTESKIVDSKKVTTARKFNQNTSQEILLKSKAAFAALTEVAPTQANTDEEAVDLVADEVTYDEPNSIVTASGNVELVQAGRLLKADSITYNLNTDRVEATGNIILEEISGDIYYAESVLLKDKMRDGFVEGISGALADGSRFSAQSGEKIGETKLKMNKATYTACKACPDNSNKRLPWQLKARQVTHHKDEARISYDDATFEALGVPVAYIPYFSHPDGSIDRKSGFLTPTVGLDSQQGASYEQEYYYSIAPDKDATVGVSLFTDEAPLLQAEYRQRFKNAGIRLQGGATYSGRTDRVADEDVSISKDERAHLFVDGLWNINDKWRAGTELRFVSDDQYLSQYNLLNDDILENTAYLERFEGRHYANARLVGFKDLRVSERRDDQPSVLPELYAEFTGQPNETLGGRWKASTSYLGLRRSGNEQDVDRLSGGVEWQRRHVAGVGVVNTLDVLTRADAYRTGDRDTGIFDKSEASALRGFARAHLESSYPVSKSFDDYEVIFEPVSALTFGSNVSDNDDIPNEDSQDVFLDVTNIFNANRFPGADRIEDGAVVTYGLRSGLYRNNGYRGEAFLGQSYRLDDEDNPFPEGSGLSDQNSDFVGSVALHAGNKLQLNYGMQLASDNLSSKRHEIDATGRFRKIDLNARYFYADALAGTDLDESREQLGLSARYRFNDRLSFLGGMQYDLADETDGLRYARYGLDYEGQCVNFLISGQRTLTRDSSGDSGTEIMVRLGLKNLGEFEATPFTIGADDGVSTISEDDDISNNFVFDVE